MSSTAAWKYHAPFPFCPEHKTTAQISALHTISPVSGLLKFASLDDAMEKWWLLESIDLTTDYNGTTNDESHDIEEIVGETKVAPADRVCADGGEGVSYLATSGQTFQWEAVYYNTTTSEWWMFFNILELDDDTSGVFFYTKDVAPGGSTYTFTISMFGQTQTLYTDDPLASITAFTPTYYTIA